VLGDVSGERVLRGYVYSCGMGRCLSERGSFCYRYSMLQPGIRGSTLAYSLVESTFYDTNVDVSKHPTSEVTVSKIARCVEVATR
jgi:hypothetical protein